MAASIQVLEKASNVCLSCRVRKQKCDRALPKCSRCATKLKRCDYTTHMNLSSHTYSGQPAEAFLQSRPSGHDLSWRGSTGLLQAAHEIHELSFMKLVYHIFDLTHVTPPSLLQDYLVRIHPWLPVVGKSQLQESCLNPPGGSKPLSPLLLLVLLLVTRPPCGPEDRPATSVLYVTLKQLLATLQPSADSHHDLLQCNLLITLYECGQGLTSEAYLTLSLSIALEKLTFSLMRQARSGDTDSQYSTHREKVLVILDRTILGSRLDHQAPLICSSQGSIDNGFQFDLSTLTQNLSISSDNTLRKLQLTGQVALITGRALEFACDVKDGGDFLKEYDALAGEVENMVATMMRANESHSWMFCDGIAMGLSCLLALRQAAVQQTHAFQDSKEDLALKSSRRMAWDMCKASMDMIKRPSVSQLSLVGMCHVFRAAVVFSDSLGQDVTAEELAGLLPTLRWFSERWAVGVQYLKRIESSIEQSMK